MIWPFSKKKIKRRIEANSVVFHENHVDIDVRGQTCPGYLLAINKVVDTLEKGTKAHLLITYPPCGDDVKAWCKERDIEYLGIFQQDAMWVIHIQK